MGIYFPLISSKKWNEGEGKDESGGETLTLIFIFTLTPSSFLR